jgi:hypothetical protein
MSVNCFSPLKEKQHIVGFRNVGIAVASNFQCARTGRRRWVEMADRNHKYAQAVEDDDVEEGEETL